MARIEWQGNAALGFIAVPAHLEITSSLYATKRTTHNLLVDFAGRPGLEPGESDPESEMSIIHKRISNFLDPSLATCRVTLSIHSRGCRSIHSNPGCGPLAL